MARPSDTRERLMNAVSELIWTNSYGSTTVEQICEKAGVLKGSFYHFFSSKSELACAAVEAGWEQFRTQYDRIFSPSRPPLERLRDYARHCLEEQRELKRRFGHVLGCPLLNLGTEVSTQDDALRQLVQRIMRDAQRYLETTVRDAMAEGRIEPCDPASKARLLYALGEGLLSQARIQNNAEILSEMEDAMLDVLRVRKERANN